MGVGAVVVLCLVIAAFIYFVNDSYSSGRRDEANYHARLKDPTSWEYQAEEEEKKQARSDERLRKMDEGEELTAEEEKENDAEIEDIIREYKDKKKSPPTP